MVRIDSFRQDYTGSFNFDYTQGSNIITVLDNDPILLKTIFPSLPSDFVCSGYLTELFSIERAYTLGSSELPQFEDTDTDRDRILKANQLQWNSPRYHLNFYISGKTTISSINDWVFIGTVPILNTGGFKYTRHRPFDLLSQNLARPFGKRAKLGIQIEDAGFGTLNAGDSLGIDLVWHQEATIVQEDYTPVIITSAQTTNVTAYADRNTRNIGTASQNILSAKAARISCSVTNNSASAIVYIGLDRTPTASANDGAISASSTINITSSFKGQINALANAAATSITTTETYQQ